MKKELFGPIIAILPITFCCSLKRTLSPQFDILGFQPHSYRKWCHGFSNQLAQLSDRYFKNKQSSFVLSYIDIKTWQHVRTVGLLPRQGPWYTGWGLSTSVPGSVLNSSSVDAVPTFAKPSPAKGTDSNEGVVQDHIPSCCLKGRTQEHMGRAWNRRRLAGERGL